MGWGRMRAFRWVAAVALALALGAGPSYAQANAKAELKAVEKALVGLPLGLRGYSAEPMAEFDWDGAKLVPQPAEWHALSVFATKSVKLERDRIVLVGEWNAMLPAGKFGDEPVGAPTPMRVEVNLKGGDAAVVLASLRDGLFFADEQEAKAGLPTQAAEALGVRRSRRQIALMNGAWSPIEGRITPPKVTHAAEPEFSERARAAKKGGNVLVHLIVSESGRPLDLWVIRPFGWGLDQQAMKAVSQYVFRPAEFEGHAVGTALMVEVNFQIF
jgi:TonB family protein